MQRLVVGNWKMHTERTEAVALAKALAQGLKQLADWDPTQVGVGVAPPFPFLEAVGGALSDGPVELVAQSCHAQPSGAFTGAVSVGMLRSVGVQRVIVGHSERRQLFGEDDQIVQAKLHAILEGGLRAILCVGETLEQRDAGQHRQVVERQLAAALDGLTPLQIERLALAYEPVWAIGTGRTASPEQAGEMHAHIREQMGREKVPILYGGSVKPGNIGALAATPGIDGALVGGASLKAESFLAIVQGTQSLR